MFDFTPDNAAEFLKLLSPLGIVIATYVFTRTNWHKLLKVALVFVFAALVSVLTAYSEGNLDTNFWSNFTELFTASQLLFWGIMKAAGLEAYVRPKEALASKASEEVGKQVEANISVDTARAILDPDKTPALDVTATVVDQKTDIV